MRAAILILAIPFPAVAAAQDNALAAKKEGLAVAPAQTQGAPRSGPPAERKRRGSMVGYIADATIESQVRVRFDAGLHNNIPDRSEFFYAQCGCNGPDKPGPKGLVTDLNFQQVTVDAQYAAKGLFAVFASVPVRFIQPQTFFAPAVAGSFANQSGLGDVRAGVKAAIVSTDDTTLTGQVQGYFQTGDAGKGLGTDHASVEAALLLYQRLSDRFAIESQLGDWHPIGGSKNGSSQDKYAGDVLFYGIGPSFELVNTGHVVLAPVMELVGWHVLGGFQVQAPPVAPSVGVVPADGTNIVNLKFGVRTTVGDRSSFYIGYGRALTDAVWYSDIVRIDTGYSF